MTRKSAAFSAVSILIIFALACPAISKASSNQKPFKCFIVSDSHFGWKHPAQPSNSTIAHGVKHIMHRFPDLNLFIDTGDIHHSDADDRARADWTEIIQGGANYLPFHVAAGNHETVTFNGVDSEKRTMALSSITCRPYYSFDLQGIHFICLPQLITPNLVTHESIEWLKLDLKLNKDKTTVIFTHNSLKDTTSSHDSKIYRMVANSDEVLKLLDSYPNVIAWMHGHNHTWELVEKNDRFYVSNGRIGGFSPSFNKDFRHHIGGIYFEIGKNHFTVKAYDATAKEFFDEKPGYKHLTKTMKLKTSYNPETSAAVSWGMGCSRDGQKVEAFQHHIGSGKNEQELVLAPCKGGAFNENQNLSITSENREGWSKGRLIPGISISPKKTVEGEIDGIRFIEEGIELLPLGENITKRSLHSPKRGAYYEYYQIMPGQTYKASAEMKAEKYGAKCGLIFRIYDTNGNLIHTKKVKPKAIDTGKTIIKSIFTVPDSLKGFGMYGDDDSSNVINLAVEAKITEHTMPVKVYKFAVEQASVSNPGDNFKVRINDRSYKAGLKNGEIKKFKLGQNINARETVNVSTPSDYRLTWTIKQTGLKWQVRNAPAEYLENGEIKVGPIRNKFSENNEIIIVPLKKIDVPYVHRMKGISKCRIQPYNPKTREIRIYVEELKGEYHEVKFANVRQGASNFVNMGKLNFETFAPNIFGAEILEEGLAVIKF
ncbi:metallophosphoesterase family protein [Sedimentisphaera salicampi]|uniref:metallophosphoesterase family protein n=1 Tax=Sedimentisphaera salicampi TaxID=1941349 RepID=UPI000B9A3912|nr:metallophosphoesterase [Sedimentisphaera salicampi]OXU15959.1 metallophosphoesterase, family [Sedimentisphaera salicampi]